VNIVFLSSVDWGELWQRHHVLSTMMARNGHRVVYVGNTGFRNPNPLPSDCRRIWSRIKTTVKKESSPHQACLQLLRGNLTVINPLVAPPQGRLYRSLNRRVFVPKLSKQIREILGEVDLAMVYLPSRTTLDLLKSLRPRQVIYECVANFGGHPGAPRDFAAIEHELLEMSDAVVCDSEYLYEKMSKKHMNTYKIHQGVDIELWDYGDEPQFDRAQRYDTICYFGTLDERMDWVVIEAFLDARIEVVLVGEAKVRLPKGVTFLGPVENRKLPSVVRRYDAFIIPYKSTKFADGIIPAKLFECFATGKPILASPLPFTQEYQGLIYVCKTPPEFIETFRSLPATETQEIRAMRREVARRNSTSAAYAKLMRIIMSNGTSHA